MNDVTIALVTGASSGIGKALVRELLARGYEVIGVSSSPEKLNQLQKEIEHPLLSVYPCDVAKLEDVKAVSTRLQQAGKIPKLFFLNAGTVGHAAIEPEGALDLELHQRVFAVNYFGVLNFVKEWSQPCKENGGATFVVSSSILAIFAPRRRCAYSASKSAVSKAFDGLRLNFCKDNLKFLSIFVCPVDTPGLSAQLPFTWSPLKMAKYMVRKAEKGKAHAYPSWLFTGICKLLNKLPTSMVAWLMRHEKTRP